jgi:hypothetical protein
MARKGLLIFEIVLMIYRIISGAVGALVLIATVVFILDLLAMGLDARVLLAAYAALGSIMLGAYLLFYALLGEWPPNRARRKDES